MMRSGIVSVDEYRQPMVWRRLPVCKSGAVQLTHLPTAAAKISFMIGHPVAHTALPDAMARWAQQHARDVVFCPVDMTPDAFVPFLAAMRGMQNCAGAVVTAPHKQAVTALMDDLTPTARLTGIANVVLRQQDGSLTGDNTDGAGFVAAMQARGSAPAGQRGIVFGCGGAGAAIAAALVKGGIAHLALVDSDTEKAIDLAARLGAPCVATDFVASVAGFDLVVNATATGLDGQSLVHPLTGLVGGTLVADVVTKPPVTAFLQRAQQGGATIQTGADMARAQLPLIVARFGWGSHAIA